MVDITLRKLREIAELAPLLEKLQGNILKGHGRDHVTNIFLRFKGAAEDVRRVLAPIAAEIVTSAAKQLRESQEQKQFGIPGNIFGNVFLTAAGYRALGFDEATLADTFPEAAEPAVRSNFKEGMRAHSAEFRDPDPAVWDATFNQEIHLLVLLADDDPGFLLRRARQIMDRLSMVAVVLGVEHGHALRDENGQGIEHFGYADGRSQPVFLADDLPNEGPMAIWDPVEPLDCVLVQDRGVRDDDAFGSYYVFRKLEQNVLGFLAQERELADALGLQGVDRARAGAMAVGRFRDGTPLALAPTSGLTPRNENDFRYDGGNSEKCPFHAHIRKTNPRGDIAKLKGLPENQFERSRRIVRRGIPYGDRPKPPHEKQDISELPTAGVGLLFSCFQAGIGRHFGFIQAKWANVEEFVQLGTGLDPVVSNPDAAAAIPQKWPRAWGQAGSDPFDFGHFVTMKGGEFFFAPSIPFLQRLAPP